MRLNPKFKRGNDYGKKTYTPMIQQTDHGISKFYSILKYLVCVLHNIILHVYMYKWWIYVARIRLWLHFNEQINIGHTMRQRVYDI